MDNVTPDREGQVKVPNVDEGKASSGEKPFHRKLYSLLDNQKRITIIAAKLLEQFAFTAFYKQLHNISKDNYTEDDLGSGDYDSTKEPCFREENAHFNRIFLPTVYSIIFLTGIVGNGLVILVMGYQKKLRSMTDKYRLHLSVADLLFVLTLPFWAVDAVANWYFGKFLCKAVHVIYTVNLYSSVLILAFISLDRYLAIVHATNSQRPRKLLAEKVVYVGVWIPALLLTIPDFIFANVREADGRYICDRFYPSDLWLVVFQFQHIVVGLILPGIVILSCYCIIISKLSHSKGYQKRKALKTTVILILAFFACWLPYYIGISIDSFILLEIIQQGLINARTFSFYEQIFSAITTVAVAAGCFLHSQHIYLNGCFKGDITNVSTGEMKATRSLRIHVTVSNGTDGQREGQRVFIALRHFQNMREEVFLDNFAKCGESTQRDGIVLSQHFPGLHCFAENSYAYKILLQVKNLSDEDSIVL
ncbi:hypothetical protein E2I00_011749 [Balaenoptera physalus]|uniref:C-X-C chemokine receptor type 4 n=1 Tax=Balaenoptera physalus TaxID=9770 RepID=A0A643C0E0_BALPH|nr:hypothetical protein E2I00_011749 [Balaenoptera physalus]